MQSIEQRWEGILEQVRESGAEAGKSAAGWMFDGNTSADTANAFVAGFAEGDPEYLDQVPVYHDATGEDRIVWDSLPWDIEREQLTGEQQSAVYAAFADGFGIAAQHEAERLASVYASE